MTAPVIDVAELPDHAYGHRSLMWWGGASFMAIEGMMFALLFTSYLYLKGRSTDWPPGFFPPALRWGTVNTVVLLASAVPNELARKAAERKDLRAVRIWLGTAILFAVAFATIRALEFRSLNVWWDSNAYGSVVWTLLGFHTTHVITDLLESIALEVLLFTGPLKPAHFTDAAENAIYWHYVVITWIPVYAFLYLAPRLS